MTKSNFHNVSSENYKFVHLTFTQGFLLGQLSLIIIVVLFIKYVVFENQQQTSHDNRRQQLNQSQRPRRSSIASSRRRRPSSSHNDRNPKTLVPELLSKLSYDLSTHPPETADWLNVLVAQAIVAYRSLVHGELDEGSSLKGEKAKQMVEEALNVGRDSEPGFISVDYITVTEVDFGDQFPLCSNARVRPADETGRMRIEVDVDYADHVTLAIETKVVINFPTSRFAVLPVSLGLTLNQISATIMAEIPPVAIPLSVNEDSSTPSPAILLSLDPDFTLSMSTTSLLGARAKLEDIPKVEQLILGRLRGWIVDNLVWPKVRVLRLPGVGSKGAVENGENGVGEYVWVESEVMPVDESTKFSSTQKLSPEADKEASSPTPSHVESINDEHPTPTDFEPPSELPSHQPRSIRYRSTSTSSRLTNSRPSGHFSKEFTTPPRVTTKPDWLQPSPSPSKSNIHNDQTFSDTSFSPYRRGQNLRHSTSMLTNPNQLYRRAFANQNGIEHFQSLENQSKDDQEKCSQVGGIWGLSSLGINNGSTIDNNHNNNTSFGIRERVKEVERIRATRGESSTTSISGSLFRD
ncbi:hypothetical protein CROQUDRAFT_88213 [Cronartium quercuum f. sp. fusiforme G11]|uniref:Maintenance of mitochondrial morphology protein 1 n=1 Tax=Cronartium quercuum f. sp. fusiforme G11 TaxID=708437 RepID=A0A9P6NV92_9BASI|nr:hypothetical protein CROQUDRAFT_88213 [Cronartium quercuum f. sp. fusiforme G11]